MGIGPRARVGQTRGFGKGPVKGFQDFALHTPTIATQDSTTRPGKSLSPGPTSHVAPRPILKDASEDIIPEIIVSIDDMEFIDIDSPESVSTPVEPVAPSVESQTPRTLGLPHMTEGNRLSFASSLSVLSDLSDLSSLPSSLSSKATTPVDPDSTRETAAPPANPALSRASPRRTYNVRPKVSIPAEMTPAEYARQCVAAAEASRLNPFALHPEEYVMLREHISHAQVTTYLNIRNGILRLWVKNPQIGVARDEAIGCAKDSRWFDAANVCFDWLVRRGYINFGCVHVKPSSTDSDSKSPRKRKTVAVIGAGMSGLGCARQLEGLFNQYATEFRELGEDMPHVVVLEGRNRIGGRVYSRPFRNQPADHPAPGFEELRCTAEMGGMIITGFERGNPMNVLVRGQLGLKYHALRPQTSIYDANGKQVDPGRDKLCEDLYNVCLDRVSEYKFKVPPAKLIEGNQALIQEGRDGPIETHKTIAYAEEAAAAEPHAPPVNEQNLAPKVDLVPVSSDRVTGRAHFEPGRPGTFTAAFKAKVLGWALKPGITEDKDIDLKAATKLPGATLGSVVDEAITQYKDIVDLNAQDFRLFNWHIANLEYANAINYGQLSLKFWDIDVGHEWDGQHTMVIGGYQGVPRGLMLCPTPLDVRRRSPVKKVTYALDGPAQPARIECEDGQTVDADIVVSTLPLGVLKHGNVEFQPPLPSWKSGAVQRLGFGVLNKVILVYKEAFWDQSRDFFGVLRHPASRFSLNQREYAPQRGRFFQWLNVSNTTGLPCLLVLMAGDAAFHTEQTSNDDLIAEATEVLRSVFGPGVPAPEESVVTRWASDKFARGSYSSAAPGMKEDDYELMARPVGNLFFAGEHTTGTHPATVHGAYLSGLRAASEVIGHMLGPIDMPTPLIIPKDSAASLKRGAAEENKDLRQARLEAYEVEILDHIISQIGPRPQPPAKAAPSAYLLFSKANYEAARKKCEEGRRPGKGKPAHKDVQVITSKMWKDVTAEERRPFEEQAEAQKKTYTEALSAFTAAVLQWDRQYVELRAAYEAEHPSVPSQEELAALAVDLASQGRRSKRVQSYAESDSDAEMSR